MSTRQQATSPLRSRITQHKEAFSYSLAHLWQNPVSTWITLAAIAIALSLPAGLYILLGNLKTLTDDNREVPTISIYIKQNITEQQAQDRAELLSELKDIENVKLIKREDGLKHMKQISGVQDIIDTVGGNPLPHVLVVTPRMSMFGDSDIDLDELALRLKNYPEVDSVQMDTEWVQRLRAILNIAERVVLVVGFLLGLTVLLVVGNTIRLNIENRREEIEVSQLVGATTAYVRRPFLYGGIWYGLFGGILSLVIVHSSLLFMIAPVNRLAELYGSHYYVSGLGTFATLIILVCSSLLGLFGAWIAMAQHLRRQHAMQDR
ncbi:permease-like cell division protein FtsX [Leucothrix pacifica]|uniref:Cell division protein FtsX n=1 Tax=Leucothrix pacifica TaxID=1247513 RepID=A0A317CMN5_9GAMM|nr:permease-like cell division protein FtsX [Leucothrix pacifica]PWQ99808.1 cell division protein FtsX [Leucothrix pacifica]